MSNPHTQPTEADTPLSDKMRSMAETLTHPSTSAQDQNEELTQEDLDYIAKMQN